MSPDKVEKHTTVVKNYYTTNHFPHSYDWYSGRPTVYVGGGYSSLFWWTLLDMSLQQRALWMYHNESLFLGGQLNRQLYDEQLKNVELKAEVDKLRKAKTPTQEGYLPPEFKNNPEAVLDTQFVQAAYQQLTPPAPASSGWGFWTWSAIVIATAGVGFCLFLLVTKIQVTSD